MALTFYHNPRCSKSRQAKELLDERGVDYETCLYLQTPPSTDELAAIIKGLGFTSARDLIRTKQKEYKELGLAQVENEQSLIAAMCEHPVLIERPILLKGKKAALGRPPENILDLL